MSAHTHTVITPGCYRCDLNVDEVKAAQQDEAEQVAREAACTEHDWITRGTPGSEWQSCYLCGAEVELS